MSDKTALLILSEIVQSLEGIREIAMDLSQQSISYQQTRLPEHDIQEVDMSAEGVLELESMAGAEELEAAEVLLNGCDEIEERAVEMIKICLEFGSPI